VNQKRCARCEDEKPASEFAKNPKLRSGLDSYCHSCKLEAQRRSRAKHKDRYNAARRKPPPEPRICPICGSEFRSRQAQACPGRCAARWNRLRLLDEIRQRERVYARGRGSVARRRKRQAAYAAGDVRTQDVRRLLRRACCPLCGVRFTKKGLRARELDHIVPLAAGGAHTLVNLRVICRLCNRSRPDDASDVAQESLWARVA